VKVATLSKKQIDEFPQGAVWNAFVDLLCSSTESELSTEQIPAFHAFWYDAEVQNGGHLQYLLNRGADEAARAVPSLRSLGAGDHAALLEKALTRYEAANRRRPRWPWQYAKRAREGELDEIDLGYHDIKPTLFEVLGAHLQQHQPLFVVLAS
jgi:hypothetical protein